MQGIDFSDLDTSNMQHVTQETIGDYLDIRDDTPTTVVSQYRSRSADQTKVLPDDGFEQADYAAADQAQRWVEGHADDLITATVQAGEEQRYTYQLIVPEPYARIAYSLLTLYDEAPMDADPDFTTVQLPHWTNGDFVEPENGVAGDAKILVDPDTGSNLVLGSDYTGEAKKGFLRQIMYDAKQDGGLGLHAGCRHVTYDTVDGPIESFDAFAGLSGTGKTSNVNHDPVDGRAAVVQDDVIILGDDGAVYGTEPGMYVKTNGLTRDEQPRIYDAVMHPSTVLENVVVHDGRPDFHDTSLTTNGRAAVARDQVTGTADHIDMPTLDNFFHITRNKYMPAVARLTPEQSAAFFLLGESVETGAGDEDRIGETVRCFGYNPFVIGSKEAEANRFLDLIEEHGVDSYILNTGYLGDEDRDIRLHDTTAITDAIAKDEVTWRYDPVIGMDVPVHVPGLDIDELHPTTYLDDFSEAWAEEQVERITYINDTFDERLDPRIRDALR